MQNLVLGCGDCHVSYKRVGAYSDHHVRSLLLNVNTACQTCHRKTEEELKNAVYDIQDRTKKMRDIALNALTEFIDDLKK